MAREKAREKDQAMASISVAQAKDQLPSMLRRVEAGEVITITRHGRPVATVVAAAAPADAAITVAAEKRARRIALYEQIEALGRTLPPQPDSLPMIRGMRGYDDGTPWE
jgi:prevent-host-death family protein